MIKRLLACVTALLLASSVSAAPNVGDKAPDWVLAGSDGANAYPASITR